MHICSVSNPFFVAAEYHYSNFFHHLLLLPLHHDCCNKVHQNLTRNNSRNNHSFCSHNGTYLNTRISPCFHLLYPSLMLLLEVCWSIQFQPPHYLNYNDDNGEKWVECQCIYNFPYYQSICVVDVVCAHRAERDAAGCIVVAAFVVVEAIGMRISSHPDWNRLSRPVFDYTCNEKNKYN